MSEKPSAPPVRLIFEDEVLLAIAVFLHVHGKCDDEGIEVQRMGRLIVCSCARCSDYLVHEVLAARAVEEEKRQDA